MHGNAQGAAREFGAAGIDQGMALEQRCRGDAQKDAAAVHLGGPLVQVGRGSAHRMVDTGLVHGADLAVNHAAHAQLLHRIQGGIAAGNVGDGGNACGNGFQASHDRGRMLAGGVHLVLALVDAEAPVGIGHVMDDAAQGGCIHVAMDVHETGHEHGVLVCAAGLFGVAGAERVGVAHILDLAVSYQHGAVFDGIGSNRQHVISAKKHSNLLCSLVHAIIALQNRGPRRARPFIGEVVTVAQPAHRPYAPEPAAERAKPPPRRHRTSAS